ncbi:E3 ubiquitin-protein ligase MARCH6 [Apostasia shenzhenica]|uniref:E3 ubiquitin-protein ligase MARCH6 n=1 Tax=Apostasia shenzhenica TaxID=1088818 RepID=A0A2I0AFA0_9ASPA|nr:E3 ubiquitin-protein ligase MARCH6 [Apostasia shenzhenica]
MPQDGPGTDERQEVAEGSGCDPDWNPNRSSNSERDPVSEPPPALTIVISQPDGATSIKGDESKRAAVEREEKVLGVVAVARKGVFQRSESDHEQCRVCQQRTEEPLIDLGCGCRGELAKAHRSCIGLWFRSRGSNKCEICQQVAVNVASPDSQPITNYWVWRVESAYGASNTGRQGRQTWCFNPLWIAFTILIGGLLLDVLISVSLGVSALPVNVIIGLLIVLGLGTALRLSLECFQEQDSRTHAHATETNINPGYQPSV